VSYNGCKRELRRFTDCNLIVVGCVYGNSTFIRLLFGQRCREPGNRDGSLADTVQSMRTIRLLSRSSNGNTKTLAVTHSARRVHAPSPYVIRGRPLMCAIKNYTYFLNKNEILSKLIFLMIRSPKMHHAPFPRQTVGYVFP